MNKINLSNIFISIPISAMLLCGFLRVLNFDEYESILNRAELLYKLTFFFIGILIISFNIFFIWKSKDRAWQKLLALIPMIYIQLVSIFLPEIRMFFGSKLQILIFTFVGFINVGSVIWLVYTNKNK